MTALAPPEIPTGYSARRAMSQLMIVVWILVSLLMWIFHGANAANGRDMNQFYASEVIGALAILWLIPRSNDLMRLAASAFVALNACAWLIIGGLAGFLFIAVPGAMFAALVWSQPPHPRSGRLEGSAGMTAMAVIALVVLVDLGVLSGALDVSMRADACFVWCE